MNIGISPYMPNIPAKIPTKIQRAMNGEFRPEVLNIRLAEVATNNPYIRRADGKINFFGTHKNDIAPRMKAIADSATEVLEINSPKLIIPGP